MNTLEKKSTILVAGGAGYIGSHMVKMLLAADYHVLTLDNLVNGYRDAVLGGEFIFADLANRAALESIFDQYQIDAVMHFASYIQVGESVQKPADYYANNVTNTLNLLEVMLAHQVKRFIFSSTAAIFGEPQGMDDIAETHPKNPINPYGRSKWMIEQALQDYQQAYDFRSVCLRYFNAAGADPEGELGERHVPETHLIPLVLQAAAGERDCIRVYGRDYDTPDGTCVRDYIHINDLCQAHLLALQQLLAGANSAVYNLGNGVGFSVQQVIDVACQVTGIDIPVKTGERRAGDPARLVACADLARHTLGWQPEYPDLKTLIAHAWQWQQGKPNQ